MVGQASCLTHNFTLTDYEACPTAFADREHFTLFGIINQLELFDGIHEIASLPLIARNDIGSNVFYTNRQILWVVHREQNSKYFCYSEGFSSSALTSSDLAAFALASSALSFAFLAAINSSIFAL